MKAKMIITTVALLFSINALQAVQSESVLTFWNSMGEELLQPAMMEEATEVPPLEVRCAFESMRNSSIYETIDLSEFARPEKEEALPYYLEQMLHSSR